MSTDMSACVGTCTLVGAGPGDPDLLTVKAVKAIGAATVLFVDDLVSDAVLEYASASARIVRVGKRGGCKSTPQAFIERQMITAAREGERVVRLKGGDPFIFGRGGEEVQHLRKAGIECQVVNGITSGIAAATALGVPLTHRDHSQGVVLITGHAATGQGTFDWRALAALAHEARLTLVIYMGISSLGSIVEELLSGLPGHLPAAAVQDASLPGQRYVVTTLQELQQDIAASGLSSPAIIILGDVLQGLKVTTNPTAARELLSA